MLSDNTHDGTEALLAALVEIESFVGRSGWDQPARLFGLVPTAELIAAEPSLADQLTVTSPDALSSIEQEDFHPGTDLFTALSRIVWPWSVPGSALSTERSFLPPECEADIPSDPGAAAEFVAHHPQRVDVRVVAGCLRVGSGEVVTHCLARLKSNPDDLLTGAEMVPALTQTLVTTLATEPTDID